MNVYHPIKIRTVKYNSLAFCCVGFFYHGSAVRARFALTSDIICMASTLADLRCTSDGEAATCSRRGVWPGSRVTSGSRRGSLSTWKQTTRYGKRRELVRYGRSITDAANVVNCFARLIVQNITGVQYAVNAVICFVLT